LRSAEGRCAGPLALELQTLERTFHWVQVKIALRRPIRLLLAYFKTWVRQAQDATRLDSNTVMSGLHPQ